MGTATKNRLDIPPIIHGGVLQYWLAFANDLQRELGVSLAHDIISVTSRYESEGDRFFTFTLPQLEKALLDGLEYGLLHVPSSFRMKSKSIRLPKLFFRLWQLVFSNRGLLRDDFDPSIIFWIRTLVGIYKKAKVQSPPGLEEKALAESLKRDEDLQSLSQLRRNCADSNSLVNELEFTKISKLSRNLLAEVLRPLDLEDIKPSIGKGATSSNDELIERYHTVYYTYDETLQEFYPWEAYFLPPGAEVSNQYASYGKQLCLPLYPLYPSLFYDPLCTRFERGEYGPRQWDRKYSSSPGTGSEWAVDEKGYFDAENRTDWFCQSLCSTLKAVDKTAETKRIIGKQPAALMALQKGQQKALYSTIERHPLTAGHVNFSDQTVNRQLALLSSINRKYVTIDLKDASDSNLCELVEWLLSDVGTDLVPLLLSTRAEFTKIDWPDGSMSFRKMRRYADMGSATTFPVMALCLWALSVSALVILDNMTMHEALNKTFVYGDDIITPKYFSVAKVLEAFGFKLSETKCFKFGYFRESCGCDAYMGVDVTPIRIRKTTHPSFSQLKVGHNSEESKKQDIATRCKAAMDLAYACQKKRLFNLEELLYKEIEATLHTKLPLGLPESGFICRISDIKSVLSQPGVKFIPNNNIDLPLLTEEAHKLPRHYTYVPGYECEPVSGSYWLTKPVYCITPEKEVKLDFPIRNYWEALCSSAETSAFDYDVPTLKLRKKVFAMPIYIM